MNDDYEIFDNVDVPDAQESPDAEKHPDKKKIIHGISLVAMLLLLGVSVANLLACIDLYKKYDNLNINTAAYLSDNEYIMQSADNNIVEKAGDIIVAEYTTEMQTSVNENQNTVTSSSKNTAAASSVGTQQYVTQTTVAQTSTGAAADNSALININTATVEELTVLTGIGEVKAQSIVEYRKENGDFYSVEDITNVSGIGEKTLEKIIDKITVE